MIPSYNRTPYLESTLASVLQQDPGPEEMQIAVIDDASPSDDPEPLVRRVGGDRVTFIRQPLNLGQFANVNNCIQRARGYWIHILHSDDLVLPGFYSALKASIKSRDDIGAAFCRYQTIDQDGECRATSPPERSTPGILPRFIESIGVCNRIETPSIVVRRTVYEKLGGYRLDLPQVADWEMWIRIAAHYPVWYEPATAAAWRVHPNSITAEIVLSGENIADLRRCVEISRSLLPAELAPSISRKAKDHAARLAISCTFRALLAGDLPAAFRQARETLRCKMSWRTVVRTLLFMPFRLAGEPLRRRRAAGRRPIAGEPAGVKRAGSI
jgi:glycosyltransferase involved in cell wall biosynthesis